MIIVWRGRGFAIAFVAVACLGLSSVVTGALAGENYLQAHGWWTLAGFWMAAIAVYALRSWLGVGQARVLIDKSTGQEVRINREGALFFVPARFWPALLVGLGLWFNFVVMK